MNIPGDSACAVYTIGHSNHSIEAFIALLRGAGVTAVADVRSAPYSRRHPQFGKREIETSLRAAGIAPASLTCFLATGWGRGPRTRDATAAAAPTIG